MTDPLHALRDQLAREHRQSTRNAGAAHRVPEAQYVHDGITTGLKIALGWVDHQIAAADETTPAPAPSPLREQVAAAIRPNMLFGLQDAELDGPGGTQRINEWVDWIATAVLAVPAIQHMQATSNRMVDVQGRCPACGWESLFLGDGGYVTCFRLECPEPDAASTVLERRPAPVPADVREQIAAAIWERQNPGRRYADCEHPWMADAEEDADTVLRVPAIAEALAVEDQLAETRIALAMQKGVSADLRVESKARGDKLTALKRAHVALASQAGKDQAALERVRAECDAIEADRARLDANCESFGDGYADAAARIRLALDPQEQP
ncbi:DUF6085 family protein [Streptomyces sp. A3M-1-3]|uniref:DUF6085 family protein n=1 Tax=Streptomyces sp. A3M-1-3 TaxID=2962044 RepID=UPI0020B8F220|nr:DUF6085 family protein [Streptomyces sp. A3M-1-3]MCP3820098.1 DUF6085 family protein [Streptomyces sp. A3M-1-3]